MNLSSPQRRLGIAVLQRLRVLNPQSLPPFVPFAVLCVLRDQIGIIAETADQAGATDSVLRIPNDIDSSRTIDRISQRVASRMESKKST